MFLFRDPNLFFKSKHIISLSCMLHWIIEWVRLEGTWILLFQTHAMVRDTISTSTGLKKVLHIYNKKKKNQNWKTEKLKGVRQQCKQAVKTANRHLAVAWLWQQKPERIEKVDVYDLGKDYQQVPTPSCTIPVRLHTLKRYF